MYLASTFDITTCYTYEIYCLHSSRLPHTNLYTKVELLQMVHNDVIQTLPVYMELRACTKTEIQIIKTYTDRIRACAVYSSTLRLTKAL